MNKCVKGSGGYRLPVLEWIRHGDKKHSTGNTVDTEIALYMATDGSYTCGEHRQHNRERF